MPARPYVLNQTPHTYLSLENTPRRLNKDHKDNGERSFIWSLLLCRSDDGDPETVSYFTILNADTELVGIRQVVSCAMRDIYLVTYTKESDKNLANSNTKWYTQHHASSAGIGRSCSHSFSGSLYASGMRHKDIAMRTT